MSRQEFGNLGKCPACGKQAFETRASAKRIARIAHAGVKMRLYQCRDTGWWHMTSYSAERMTVIRRLDARRKG